MVRSLVRHFTSHHHRLALLAILTLLLAVSRAEAQGKSAFEQKIWIGLHGGVNMSRYSFVPSVPQDMYIGQHAGVSMRYEIERGASAQIEFNYVQTGWKERIDSEGVGYSRGLSYIEMPILTHLYLEQSAIRAFVSIGPFVSFNLSEVNKIEGEETSFTEAQLQRQSMPVARRFLWGLTGGPGVSIKLGERHRLEAEARALYSFIDIWGNRRSDPYGQSQEFRLGARLSYFFRF